MTVDRNALFRDSVIVTGTHYSMSSLIGSILGASKTFHVANEPLNHNPTLGYATVPTQGWYEYYAGERSADLASKLMEIQFGRGSVPRTLARLPQIRSGRDVLRCGKYAITGMLHASAPKRIVFKDPFMCFSARDLQERYGLWVVITVRHPCGFAESLTRRGKGFDFEDVLQPDLLAAMPDIAEDLQRYAREPQPIMQQAALLWRLVYGFAATYLLDNPRTTFVRQEDIAGQPDAEAVRLFSLLGAEKDAAVDRYMQASLNAETPSDFDKARGRSYVHRNARETTLKWRQRLSQDDITMVMDTTGSKIPRRFGYFEDGSVADDVHTLEAAQTN